MQRVPARRLGWGWAVAVVVMGWMGRASWAQEAALADGALAEGALYAAPGVTGGAHSCTRDDPGTLAQVQALARTRNQNMQQDLVVYLRGGTYPLAGTLVFTEADSGSNGHQVIYRAYPGEVPVLSGGVAKTGMWTTAHDHIRRLDLSGDGIDAVRQLYLDGHPAPRAAPRRMTTALMWWDDPATTDTVKDGIIIDAARVAPYQHPRGMEVHWSVEWRVFYALVDAITDGGAAHPGKKIIQFKQPYFTWCMERGHPPVRPMPTLPFTIENAPEDMTREGDWCFDAQRRVVYCYAADLAALNAAVTVIPQLEKLVEIHGASPAQRVHDLVFDGLTFAHGAWNVPSTRGFASNQATEYALDLKTTGFMPGAVEVEYARAVDFLRNRFCLLGANGLYYRNAAEDFRIEENAFYDLAGGAVVIGNTTQNFIKKPTQGELKHLTIRNNRIGRVGLAYENMPAVTTFYTDGARIEHNDLADVSYTGISAGWGWENFPDSVTCRNNLIQFNRIADVAQGARDAGGIYTLGHQEDTLIAGNYLKNTNDTNGGIYLDEGSQYMLVTRNVVEDVEPSSSSIFLHQARGNTVRDNYVTWKTRIWPDATNPKYQGNVMEDLHLFSDADWPAPARQIIAQAGLESGARTPEIPPARVFAAPERDAFAPIGAATFDRAQGAQAIYWHPPVLSYVRAGGQAVYKNVDFHGRSPQGFVVELGTAVPRATLEIHLQSPTGPKLGEIAVPSTGGYRSYETFTGPITAPANLQQADVCLVFRGAADGYLYNLKSFHFTDAYAPPVNVPRGPNLALRARVWAWGQLEKNAPESAVDDNPDTLWHSGNTPFDAQAPINRWLVVDLGAPHRLAAVEYVASLTIDGAAFRRSFSLQGSNDPQFADFDELGLQGPSHFPFQGVWSRAVTSTKEYRFVRLYKNDSSPLGVAELRVFAAAP